MTFPRIAARERAAWERRSGWATEGDSTTILLFTGLQGWRVTLRTRGNMHAPDALGGVARSLSDAIVRGRAPVDYAVHATRMTCTRADSVHTSTARAGWSPQRGQPYFDFQADEPARLAPGSPRPVLAPGERVGRGTVLLQFVVDAAGHADRSTMKILRSGGRAADSAVLATIPRMRFIPARVKQRAVPVLMQRELTVR